MAVTRSDAVVMAGIALWLLAVPTVFTTTPIWGTVLLLAWMLVPTGIAAGVYASKTQATRWWVLAACIPYVAVIVGVAYLALPAVDESNDQLPATNEQ